MPVRTYEKVLAVLKPVWGRQKYFSLAGGRCVRVYWPEEDACFDGTLRGFDGRVHAVEYDDGDKHDELLGGEDTPYWRVL